MKAKIKATGEIVKVEDLYDDGTALVQGTYIKISELSFFDNIDWEQRRYEIAKETLQGILFGYQVTHEEIGGVCKNVAETAVTLADALIIELKNRH